ncbi:hypothetical protein ONZ45_g5432 [Pleurotus djamor]|nr:hypothetical protein ONZ45_g5432 [Pleurotus djamor]
MSDQVTTGLAPFKVGDQTYQTWYKIVGNLGGDSRPIVVLHGGGGMTHNYMLPHTVLATRLKVPVIFYDQLGNGQSTHLPDAPKDFWRSQLWVDELDNLVKHLGISNNFDLIGNSWGGMLGGEYAATRMPPGLKNLVVSNAPSSIPLMAKGTDALLSKYPEQQRIIRKHAEAGTFTSPEYQAAVQVLHDKHFCLLKDKPKHLIESVMVGPSIYNITGNVSSWSIIDKLHNVQCSTLVISSPIDTVQPIAITPWFENVQKVKWVELQNSTHVPMFEEPERYFDVIVAFLARN